MVFLSLLGRGRDVAMAAIGEEEGFDRVSSTTTGVDMASILALMALLQHARGRGARILGIDRRTGSGGGAIFNLVGGFLLHPEYSGNHIVEGRRAPKSLGLHKGIDPC